MKFSTWCASLMGVVVMGASQAHDFQLGLIKIEHPWARPAAAGQMAGGSYLKLVNTGGADKLLSATSVVAAAVELHDMRMDGDVMRMRQVESIPLPAGQSVELKPGGLHMMLMGLRGPLKEGDLFPLKLQFEKAGEVTVEVKVEQPKSGASSTEHRH